MEVLPPAVEVARCSCAPVVRRLSYLWNLDKNINTLTLKNQLLIAKDSDLRNDIKKAELHGMVARDRVSMLLEQVAKVIGQVNEITSSLEEINRHFFNCCSRLMQAKRVVEVTQEVDRLLGETRKFANELVVNQLPPKADLLAAQPLVGKYTTEKNMEAILESLRDPDIGKIGVYSMGGSGKTTTMMNINNHLATTNDFNKIIWVTVSKDFNLEKVQNDVAKKLSLDLSMISGEVDRASRLFTRLKQTNNFLIIFDDVWDRIPLHMVGIPEPDGDNQCKIVLTTRSLVVCRQMETQKNIKLNLLSTEEAWELFISKAGSCVLFPEVKPLAEKVVCKCDGLPLGIITVGRALRGVDDVRIWRNAVKDLNSSPTEIEGMEDQVFKLLQFSYNRLKNDKIRECFLYLSLFPEDYEIKTNQLSKYWVAEDLLNEEGDLEDLETKRDKGFKIMKELLDACMFESVKYAIDGIRMHDLLRELAIKIMRDLGGVLVKAGLGLSQSPNKNEWYQARRISLMQNKIEALHDEPNCPNLLILLLQGNPLSQNIAPSFFTQMPALQILDLSETRVSELPSSVSDLVELRALFLQRCIYLERIPSLAKLKKLRMWYLCHTRIKELPEGIEGLISLRSLDLSYTEELENCVIPKLPYLEELLMEESKFWWMDRLTITNCIKEISCLNRLTVLTLKFVRMDDYLNALTCLQWEMFKSFFIRICDECQLSNWDYNRPHALPKCVIMEGQEINIHPSNLLLPPNTQQLYMFECCIPRLSPLLRNVRFLTKCEIYSCSLVSGDSSIVEEENEELALTSLEELIFNEVEGLDDMWKGIAVPHAFPKLRDLRVVCCQCLKNLFFIDFQHLNNIEEIWIEGCEAMEKIVSNGGEGHESDTKSFLPNLHTLTLWGLPKLHTISGKMWVCASLSRVVVHNSPILKKLCFSVENLSNFEEIIGESEWWEALEWDDVHTKTLLQPRFQDPRAENE